MDFVNQFVQIWRVAQNTAVDGPGDSDSAGTYYSLNLVLRGFDRWTVLVVRATSSVSCRRATFVCWYTVVRLLLEEFRISLKSSLSTQSVCHTRSRSRSLISGVEWDCRSPSPIKIRNSHPCLGTGAPQELPGSCLLPSVYCIVWRYICVFFSGIGLLFATCESSENIHMHKN